MSKCFDQYVVRLRLPSRNFSVRYSLHRHSRLWKGPVRSHMYEHVAHVSKAHSTFSPIRGQPTSRWYMSFMSHSESNPIISMLCSRIWTKRFSRTSTWMTLAWWGESLHWVEGHLLLFSLSSSLPLDWGANKNFHLLVSLIRKRSAMTTKRC